jgi:hypothetical protein
MGKASRRRANKGGAGSGGKAKSAKAKAKTNRKNVETAEEARERRIESSGSGRGPIKFFGGKWTTVEHAQAPTHFRRVVWELLLCWQRVQLPSDVLLEIVLPSMYEMLHLEHHFRLKEEGRGGDALGLLLYESACCGVCARIHELVDKGLVDVNALLPTPEKTTTEMMDTRYSDNDMASCNHPTGGPRPAYLHAPALFMAAGKGQMEAVRLLLKLGADPNICANTGNFALAAATVDGNVPMMELLLKHGAQVNLPDASTGWTSFHLACMGGLAAAMKVLVHAGCDTTALDCKQTTGRGFLLLMGNSAMVKWLDNECGPPLTGAAASRQQAAGLSALGISGHGHAPCNAVFLPVGEDPRGFTRYQSASGMHLFAGTLGAAGPMWYMHSSYDPETGGTGTLPERRMPALILKSANGYVPTGSVRPTVLMVNDEAQRMDVEDSPDELLTVAVLASEHEVMQYTRDRFFAMEKLAMQCVQRSACLGTGWRGLAPIQILSRLGEHSTLAEEELEYQRVVAHLKSRQHTPEGQKSEAMVKAALKGDCVTIRRLLDDVGSAYASAFTFERFDYTDPDDPDPRAGEDQLGWYYSTALMCAVSKGQTEAVKLLLEHKADAAVHGTPGGSALIFAASADPPDEHRNEILHMLLRECSEGRCSDINGTAEQIRIATVMQRPACPDVLTSPYLAACHMGTVESVLALIAAGCKIDVHDEDGRDAFTVAEDSVQRGGPRQEAGQKYGRGNAIVMTLQQPDLRPEDAANMLEMYHKHHSGEDVQDLGVTTPAPEPEPEHNAPNASETFTTGSAVWVTGLKSASQHNGKRGQILGFDGAKGRYKVEVASGEAKPVRLMIKALNLTTDAP